MDGAGAKKYIDTIPFWFNICINHRGIIAKSNYTKKSIKHIVEKMENYDIIILLDTVGPRIWKK